MDINDNTEPENSSSPGLSRAIYFQLVITGLVPVIHVLTLVPPRKTWMAGTSPRLSGLDLA